MYGCFDHHRATEPFPHWVIRDCRLSFANIVESIVTNNDIVYSNLDYFKRYKEKTVLIIGGGPSSNKLDYDKTERDFTWSCNHFYLNPKAKEMKVDLAMLMSEPDLENDEAFLEYRNKYKPYLGFEVHDKWFNYEFDDYDKYFVMHTRFYSKLGIGVRMILFAAYLGCQTIKFVGLDGYRSIYVGNHAFEPGKTMLPSNFTEQLYDNQYKYFWEYTLSLFPNVKIENLGYKNTHHYAIDIGDNNAHI